MKHRNAHSPQRSTHHQDDIQPKTFCQKSKKINLLKGYQPFLCLFRLVFKMILLKNRLSPDYFYLEEFGTDHGNSVGEEHWGTASLPSCLPRSSQREIKAQRLFFLTSPLVQTQNCLQYRTETQMEFTCVFMSKSLLIHSQSSWVQQ